MQKVHNLVISNQLCTFVSLESDAPSMTRYITGACTLTIALFGVWRNTDNE